MQMTMLVLTTVLPEAVAVTTNVSATCRDRFSAVDELSFRRRACTMCFVYLFPGVGALQPSIGNYTDLVRLNGSDVVERYVVDSEDVASLDRLCRHFSGDVGGRDGCSRWTQCCTKASECCRQQRRRSSRSRLAESASVPVVAPAACAATWDGFSCWDSAPAGSVVYQQCPEYMPRADVTGSCVSRHVQC